MRLFTLIHEQAGAAGVILRVECGSFKGAKAVWHAHSLNALVMKAEACKVGVQFAIHLGVERLMLEIDCKVLVDLFFF